MREQLYRLKRSIIKRVNSIWFQYMNNRYAIAFRQRAGAPLFEKNCSNLEFILIKPTLRYWMADPFLFKYNGVNYLFAELYDKKKAKGVLAYAQLRGNKCGHFRVCIEENFHLSYPCVFQQGGDVFMIPETKENNRVSLYRAVDFPRKWKKVQDVCELPCVDTTPFIYKEKRYYFTTVANEASTDDNLHLICDSDNTVTQLLENNLCSRSAGNVIFDGERMIRPSQDDTVYGDAVVINEVISFDLDQYKEIEVKRILPPGSVSDEYNISVSVDKRKVRFNGLHTYNINEDYEVIDLRYPRLNNAY